MTTAHTQESSQAPVPAPLQEPARDLRSPPPMTLTEKIMARASGQASVQAGDEVWVSPHRMIMNDSSGPRRIAPLLESLGGVKYPDRAVIVSDHFAPAASIRHAEILKITRTWARTHGITHFYEYQGILHNLVLEKWLVHPGMMLVGADSHTVSAGAMGAMAVAIGSTELATTMASGELWLRVPETVRIELTGERHHRLDIRDLTMRLLADLGLNYANYLAIEYAGDFVDSLSLEERLVLTNQGIEFGAKNAICVPGQRLMAQMQAAGVTPEVSPLFPDANATYKAVLHYDMSRLEPMIAAHPRPNNGQSARALAGLPVDMAWLGSCVGGRLADLQAAAQVLQGRRVQVPLLVTPSTQAIYSEALADGTLRILIDAGAIINPPGCGACAGVHSGVQGPSDVVIATATRNFQGRMGSGEARVYIGSAYTVAASALAGQLIDPRDVNPQNVDPRNVDPRDMEVMA